MSRDVYFLDGANIIISDEDTRRWQEAEDKARPTVYGPWVEVTNEITGERVEVRTAPCGAPCRCAAERRAPVLQDRPNP